MIVTETFSWQARVRRAVWIGFAGGLLFGFSEALIVLAGNAAGALQALIGVVAAMGFVVALYGALGAVGLGLIGALLAQVVWLRRRFDARPAWTALCAALFAGLLSLLYSLDRFGVLAGTLAGVRAALFAGIAVLVGLFTGIATYWLILTLVKGGFNPQSSVARLARRIIVVTWIIAAVLPLVYALLRGVLS